jgi:hypothetical protein
LGVKLTSTRDLVGLRIRTRRHDCGSWLSKSKLEIHRRREEEEEIRKVEFPNGSVGAKVRSGEATDQSNSEATLANSVLVP